MNRCPKCHADSAFDCKLHFACGSVLFPDGRLDRSATCRNRECLAICRRHNSPATEPGAHRLAGMLVKVLGGEDETLSDRSNA